jgi:hypothetical protein
MPLFEIRERFFEPFQHLICTLPVPMVETVYLIHRLRIAQMQVADLRGVTKAAITQQLHRIDTRFVRAGLPAPLWPRFKPRPLSHRELVEHWLFP